MARLDTFIFEDWLALAQSDSAAFEIKRSEYIRRYLQQVPIEYRDRLIKIQWRIDAMRKLESSPMMSCLKIFDQMWESFCGPGGLMQRLNDLLLYANSPTCYAALEALRDADQQRAEVIYLDHYRSHKQHSGN